MPGDLQRLGLEVAAVNVNLKGDRAFQHGALSSPDPGVRARAVDLLLQASGWARTWRAADGSTCAPLADGYDLVFQVDYRRVVVADCLTRSLGRPPTCPR